MESFQSCNVSQSFKKNPLRNSIDSFLFKPCLPSPEGSESSLQVMDCNRGEWELTIKNWGSKIRHFINFSKYYLLQNITCNIEGKQAHLCPRDLLGQICATWFLKFCCLWPLMLYTKCLGVFPQLFKNQDKDATWTRSGTGGRSTLLGVGRDRKWLFEIWNSRKKGVPNATSFRFYMLAWKKKRIKLWWL